ncbi:hypothetical protein [Caulobacter sp. RHG1]|uniref:hypothetical protein n=1 Tax=Caulobacter sp. (strain RHG1) TaxID=2545762 RepID=UPI001552E8B9|nr:hypothetical protein [Caulobacter sp. RHG1]NQE62912.1 hypothetical protein [Caulobacter sp. RHG1]
MSVVRTDWRAVNRLGVTVRTFDDRGAACAWVAEHATRYGGLEVREFTLTERSRRVFRVDRDTALIAAGRPKLEGAALARAFA